MFELIKDEEIVDEKTIDEIVQIFSANIIGNKDLTNIIKDMRKIESYLNVIKPIKYSNDWLSGFSRGCCVLIDSIDRRNELKSILAKIKNTPRLNNLVELLKDGKCIILEQELESYLKDVLKKNKDLEDIFLVEQYYKKKYISLGYRGRFIYKNFSEQEGE